MRIGIMLNEHAGPDSLRLLTDELRRNADEGFDSSWLTHVFGVDALTALAVAGSRVPDIAIGTAVVPTYPRHPGALAQQARTTALAVGPDRLTLGIGLSHQMVIENMYGYDFARPVRHLREYLEVLMPLVDGQAVSFSGETVSANLQLSVPNDDRVPVLVAALGEQMLRLAGKRTDGTVLWMTGPTTIRDHIAPTITAAATEAGRPAPRIVCALPVLVTDDPDSARERAAKVFKIYGSLPSYRAMMDREGAAGPADLAIVGTEDQVAERVRTVFAAGATEFVGIVFADGDDATRTRKLLTDLKS
ncbi:LLM class F420-dependent oxidoreductase [Nocardia farcinica]|uniref:LLM class F420-dependent oxidoreductase n=1 Tax=Nocardia farcinica TaxID=37329 RepID=UPI000BF5C8B2|nr:LLM class F420-dependent oxidoreductase [Nocardia farcinica]MBF6290559.1 LLM class F420-dependent oxidoreductase [Nocardia farcinica]MBF6377732.1 LLM class F420-dependent oxidoreductase [Nocardia farcinica]MBF6419757.1 LLM class F420-dependent oxidoreductase [Nocardia farcinica]MBF6431234.1 LLM class F420-dependent oxidoreductase [Nocardia farcinica]MBF6501748.1 LLM class F420-dependent oxidoreductase [Nocardia farcinica]